MRTSIKLIALAAAATAAPAFAQVAGVQTGVGAHVNTGVDTGRVVGDVRGVADRTVDRTDRAVNRTVDRTANRSHRLATAADLRTGIVVRDSRGQRVGTVQSVGANTAIVVQGNRRYQVPLSSLYRTATGLVTHVPRAELRASAQADARARAGNR